MAHAVYHARCHACGRAWHSPVPRWELNEHQDRYHDEAQTVWTRAEEEAAIAAVDKDGDKA